MQVKGKAIDARRWAAVIARDRRADGSFVYAVRTTGVFCRPSCSSRRANPVNVCFYESAAQAEAAGFRACKRCRPTRQSLESRQAELIARACRSIEKAQTPPALAQLARAAGLSPYHFHRLFKSMTGVTPRQYAHGQRSKRMQLSLSRGGSVTDAIFDAGFNSSSRFYEQSDAMLGMKPSRYRTGGTDERIRFAVGQSSLGAVLVAASDNGICAVVLGDDPDQLVRDLQDRFARASLIGADPRFETLVAQVIGLVEDPGCGARLPLDVRGTAFQRRVWQALRDVPAGSTVSYAQIARRIGRPTAMRAVAQACGANPIAVAIPCHRIVRTDGALSGYRWGIERKRILLRREGVDTP